ncbi:hypothetical protein H2255_07435, partial [Campylobacter sp. RM9760]|nr:hypothetical protein [Campylobacter sp. RM9760]
NQAFDHKIKTVYPDSKTFMECFDNNIKNKKISSNVWFKQCLDKNIGSIWIAVMEMIDFFYLKTLKLKFLDGVLYEDNLFGTLLFLNTKNIYVIDKKFYNNRIRANSTMCHDNNATFQSLAPFFRVLSSNFSDPYKAREYIKLYSWTCMTFKLLLVYLTSVDNKKILKRIKFFLYSYKYILSNNIVLNEDPWGARDKINIINTFLGNKISETNNAIS